MAHGLTITRRDIARAERATSQAHALHASTHGIGGRLTTTAEVGLTAFGMGVLKGRFGPISLGPVPVDLVGFVLFGLLGLSNVAGDAASHHVMNVANGLGAGYLHTLGAGVGVSWGLKAGQTPFKTAGDSRMGTRLGALGRGNAPLTEAEIAAMAHAVR